MRKHIVDLFNYRRYVWNQALDTWNDLYDQSLVLEDKTLRPNEYKVRNLLVASKRDWQYALSSRVLQQASQQLGKAWQNFFNPVMPNHKQPKFKSKKSYQPTFTTDRARVIKGKLVLDRPRTINKSDWYGIRLSEQPRYDGQLKFCTITEKADGLYASLVFDTQDNNVLPLKPGIAGVDINVRHFNYNNGIVEVYPRKLEKQYSKISRLQRVLTRKRLANPRNYETERYAKAKTKLRRSYQQVANVQNDLIQKFTRQLIANYSEIHIEDLDVHSMQMSKKMGKNLQRSMFGRFAEILKYKCAWYNRKLVLVDQDYPSTQICSMCGFRKTKDTYGGKQTLSGDSIHHQHQTYYCYHCGAVLDRDVNAVENIKNFGLA